MSKYHCEMTSSIAIMCSFASISECSLTENYIGKKATEPRTKCSETFKSKFSSNIPWMFLFKSVYLVSIRSPPQTKNRKHPLLVPFGHLLQKTLNLNHPMNIPTKIGFNCSSGFSD
jgi:hypothetical protein